MSTRSRFLRSVFGRAAAEIGGISLGDRRVAILGAGPYGLAAAAHLRRAGLEPRVFGRPMEFWERQMPTRMLLRSAWEASNIGDPDGRLTLDAYRAECAPADDAQAARRFWHAWNDGDAAATAAAWPALRARFAPGRWQAFKRDLLVFGPHIANWEHVFLDHGYNDPPPRALLLHLLVRWMPATPRTLGLLTALDYAIVLATFWAVRRAFGGLAATLALAFLALSFFARFDFIGGSPLRWDWICALLLGAAALARRAPVAAGLGPLHLFGRVERLKHPRRRTPPGRARASGSSRARSPPRPRARPTPSSSRSASRPASAGRQSRPRAS